MERIAVSTGSWHDLLIALGIANDEGFRGDIRWCRVAAPHYAVVYRDGKPVSARLMGTTIVLVPEGGTR